LDNLFTTLFSCNSDTPVYYNDLLKPSEPMSIVGENLAGEHRVRDVIRGNEMISFMWENNQKEWITSTLPINKVRYRYENNIEPTIKFKWKSGSPDNDINVIMEHYVIYAVITTNEVK